MKNTTIFDTPILSEILHWLAKFLLKITGWKIEGQTPKLEQYVMIAAPHTSNMDGVLIIVMAFARKVKINWTGKVELFRPPFKSVLRWFGGIPIDRSKSSGVVKEIANLFKASERLIIAIAPEGTRGKVHKWKTGFHRIAKEAEVPIVLGYLDYSNKRGGFGPIIHPTEDMDDDIKLMRSFYSEIIGRIPERTSDLKN